MWLCYFSEFNSLNTIEELYRSKSFLVFHRRWEFFVSGQQLQRRWKKEEGRCRRYIRAPRSCCCEQETVLKGWRGWSTRAASTPLTFPCPSETTFLRSNLSAPIWTASGAPSPPSPNAISGKGTDSIQLNSIGVFLIVSLSIQVRICNWVMLFLCRKVEQVAEEAESLKGSLDQYNFRNQRRMNEAREREELLGRAVRNSCPWFYLLFTISFILMPLFCAVEWRFFSCY